MYARVDRPSVAPEKAIARAMAAELQMLLVGNRNGPILEPEVFQAHGMAECEGH